MWRPDWFVVALLTVLGASALFPQLGQTGGPLHLEWIARYGVAFVFFLYGLTLAREKLKAGAMHWRLHLLVQGMCFVGFPLLTLLIGLAVKQQIPPAMWLGFLFLAALPGTIASAVAMTALARGNLPAAVFNATISGVIAVVATPLLVAAMAGVGGVAIDLGSVIVKIIALILAPMALGQLLRPWLGGWAARNASWLKPLDRGVILGIVANAFADSMVQGLWSAQPPLLLLEVTVLCLALFWTAHWTTTGLSGLLGFNRADRIAAVLSASQKSLATGVPLAAIVFGRTPELGLIITPVMIYHFAQLITVSILAGRWARDPA